jgi:isoquinoline 1-oxidoreductase alpha subunit
MIELTINGTTQRLDASPEMPLLWALRDVVGLTGTKFGCGMSLCGACTVHLDGQPVRACMTPVSDAVGKPITTIEGVPADHPVKAAWKDLNVPQCGYCQAGQMMSALALLTETPQPTDDDIDVAMSGNLCRCGTYGRIRQAIHNAAKEMAR